MKFKFATKRVSVVKEEYEKLVEENMRRKDLIKLMNQETLDYISEIRMLKLKIEELEGKDENKV